MTKLKRNIRSSQGLPEAMGFSMLPHSHSAIAITNRLTGSQFRLWHYLMMVDPFADRTRNGEKIYHPIPSPAEIAVAIGASQRTVEKDMKRLEELGLYAKRITQWEGYNTTAEAGKSAATNLKNKSVCPEPKQDKGGYLTADPAKQPEAVLNNLDRGYLTADSAKQPEIAPNSPDRSSEPSPGKLSSPPQTIQTYSDFIQTLSDSERENFELFVRNEWRNQKSEEILSIERFLSKPEDLKNWYDTFLKSPSGSAAKQKALTLENDWANHPRREEWIEEIRQGRPRFIALGGPRSERLMRVSFVDWAEANNLVWGAES